MPMNNTYLDALADHGSTLLTHIGLVDGTGTEIASAGYARQPVSWVDEEPGGRIRPTTDLVFNVRAGDVVAGWRAFNAATAGSDFGGEALTQATFNNDGTYTLLAAQTYVDHIAAAA